MRKLNYFLMPMYFFLFFCVSALPCQAQELPQIVKKIAPSIVIILTYDKDGEIIGQGSGFFISSDGNIITNRHVLADANRAEAKTADGKVYPITRIAAENKDADIVRASVGVTLPVSTLSLSSSIPEVGERIAVIGSPLGLEQTVSDGIVSAVREIPEFGKIYQITAPISPGSSGSPVVNMKGEVIGVATFQFVGGQNLNFVIPSEHISRLRAEKGKPLEEWAMENMEEWLTTAEGLYFSGLIFLWTDDYEKALPYFQNAVEKHPNYADAWFCIGYCSDELGYYHEAVEAFKQAIRIKPDYAEAYYNLGVVYDSLERYYKAVEAFKQAIRIKPDDAEAYCNLGVVYGKLERYYKAVEAFKQAIRIKPDDAEAHNNLGVVYDSLERYYKAVEAYKQAIRIKPDYAKAHYNLGVTYGKLERYHEEIEAYKQAIRIKPDYAKAHYNLGVTYFSLEDRGSALQEYRILKELDEDLANRLFNLIYE